MKQHGASIMVDLKARLGASLKAEAEHFNLHQLLGENEFNDLVMLIVGKLDESFERLRRLEDIRHVQDAIKDIRRNIGKSFHDAYVNQDVNQVAI